MKTKLFVAAIGAAIALVAPTPDAPAQVSTYYAVCQAGYIPDLTNFTYCIPDDEGGGAIRRKKPKLTLKVAPRKDLAAPIAFTASGKLTSLKGVRKKRGCKGRVRVTVKSGRQTVDKASAKVGRTCRYKARLKIADLELEADRGRLKVSAKFGGNARLRPANAKTRTVKYAK